MSCSSGEAQPVLLSHIAVFGSRHFTSLYSYASRVLNGQEHCSCLSPFCLLPLLRKETMSSLCSCPSDHHLCGRRPWGLGSAVVGNTPLCLKTAAGEGNTQHCSSDIIKKGWKLQGAGDVDSPGEIGGNIWKETQKEKKSEEAPERDMPEETVACRRTYYSTGEQ